MATGLYYAYPMILSNSLLKRLSWFVAAVCVFGLNVHSATSPARWTGIWSIDGLEIDPDSGRKFTANDWMRSIQIQHTGGTNYQVGLVGAAEAIAVTELGNDLVLTGSDVDSENAQVMVDQSFRLSRTSAQRRVRSVSPPGH
jgi:hypothetical protein